MSPKKVISFDYATTPELMAVLDRTTADLRIIRNATRFATTDTSVHFMREKKLRRRREKNVKALINTDSLLTGTNRARSRLLEKAASDAPLSGANLNKVAEELSKQLCSGYSSVLDEAVKALAAKIRSIDSEREEASLEIIEEVSKLNVQATIVYFLMMDRLDSWDVEISEMLVDVMVRSSQGKSIQQLQPLNRFFSSTSTRLMKCVEKVDANLRKEHEKFRSALKAVAERYDSEAVELDFGDQAYDSNSSANDAETDSSGSFLFPKALTRANMSRAGEKLAREIKLKYRSELASMLSVVMDALASLDADADLERYRLVISTLDALLAKARSTFEILANQIESWDIELTTLLTETFSEKAGKKTAAELVLIERQFTGVSDRVLHQVTLVKEGIVREHKQFKEQIRLALAECKKKIRIEIYPSELLE